MDPRAGGVYAIRNVTNGKVYIGSALVFAWRWNDHRKQLRGRYHHNIYLERAWHRDGESAFVFEVLEVVDDPANLLIREQWWIDATPESIRYNICPIAGSNLGLKHTAQRRANTSRGRRGIPRPVTSPEHRQHLSEALRGRKPSQKTLDAASAANTGRVWTDEQRARISAGLKGKKRPPRSPEHIAKLREAAQRRMADPERRRQISETLKAKGIAPSMEARRKGAQVRNARPR